jgi:hypothetical protein
MCFLDTTSLRLAADDVSRRRFLGAGVAMGVAAAATDWGKALLPGVAEGAP